MGKAKKPEIPNPKKNKKKRATWIPLVIIMFVGLGLLLYPSVADWWNRGEAVKSVTRYADSVTLLKQEQIEQMLADARAYNADVAEHGRGGILSSEEEAWYNSVLDVNGDGMMGFIEIDKIDVTLPVYHGTDDLILQIAAGHLSWSSLPVGAATWNTYSKTMDPEDGSHCVISGHRGLPSAKLFTDLDKLEEGDTFSLTVLKDVYTYEIDQIRIVEPDDLSSLHIERGHDYCTLVTCTPYGVNSHRLLVRGTRVTAQRSYIVQANAAQIQPMIVAPIIAAPVLVILFILAMVLPGRRRNKKNSIDENIIEDLEIADLPLQKLDLSVIEINRLLEASRKANRANKEANQNKDDQAETDRNKDDQNKDDQNKDNQNIDDQNKDDQNIDDNNENNLNINDS